MKAEARLRQLGRARGTPRAELAALFKELREEPPDALLLQHAREVTSRFDASFPEDIHVWQPVVGSAYLLVAGGGGNAGRITARRAGRSYQRTLENTDRGDEHLNAVFDVLIAALAEQGTGLPAAEDRGHALRVVVPGEFSVAGDSMGVSLAVALVSLWSQTLPRADTAASAVVVDGRLLAPVAHLPAKLNALARRYPAVRRVVVAPSQADTETPPGLELIRAHDVMQALREHGLDLSRVEGRIQLRDVRRAIEDLQYKEVADNSAAEWRRQAQRARTLAFQAGPKDTLRARALGYAALFHLHAGDSGEAATLFAQLDERALSRLPAGARVDLRINAASGMIDRDPSAAVEPARHALEEARALEGEEREDTLGRALGTYARALVHAGDPQSALDPLRAAVAHHETHQEDQVARSELYLAAGLRWAGKAQEAHDIARAALDRGRKHAQNDTVLFAEYECARCLLELDDAAAARSSLARVREAQRRPQDYPRAGCLRYLTRLDLLEGDPEPPALQEALDYLPDTSGPIRDLFAAALAEALVMNSPPLSKPMLERVRAAWRTHLGDNRPDDLLAALVY